MSSNQQQRHIIELKARGDQYLLRISGEDQPLILSAELVHRYKLKAGIIITPAQIEKLTREADQASCDRYLAGLLGRRQHSIYECRLKLTRKKFSKSSIEKVISEYADRGLLDDANYAYQYARSIMNRNPAGRSFIIASLLKKGIEKELAQQTAESLFASEDDVELATRSLRRRWSVISQFELERARTKAYTYLSRRGISYDAAKQAFDRLHSEQNED